MVFRKVYTNIDRRVPVRGIRRNMSLMKRIRREAYAPDKKNPGHASANNTPFQASVLW